MLAARMSCGADATKGVLFGASSLGARKPSFNDEPVRPAKGRAILSAARGLQRPAQSLRYRWETVPIGRSGAGKAWTDSRPVAVMEFCCAGGR